MLPVPGLGIRGRLLAGFGRNANPNGPKSGPTWPSARAISERILVRSHELCGQSRPETGPEARPNDQKHYCATSNDVLIETL